MRIHPPLTPIASDITELSAGERICLDDGSGVRARKNAAGANLRRPGRSPRVPAATPTRLWASRQPWRPRSRAGGDASQPRSAFQRISILHPRVFLRRFQPPSDATTPAHSCAHFQTHPPGLTLNLPMTPLLVHTPSRSHRTPPLWRSFRVLNLPLEPPRNDHIRDF